MALSSSGASTQRRLADRYPVKIQCRHYRRVLTVREGQLMCLSGASSAFGTGNAQDLTQTRVDQTFCVLKIGCVQDDSASYYSLRHVTRVALGGTVTSDLTMICPFLRVEHISTTF